MTLLLTRVFTITIEAVSGYCPFRTSLEELAKLNPT
jgi:hypothetical protein